MKDNQLNDILFLLMGTSLLALGGALVLKREAFSWRFGYVIDYGEYHYIFGFVAIVIGGAAIYSVVRKNRSGF